jgi:arsenate reductase
MKTIFALAVFTFLISQAWAQKPDGPNKLYPILFNYARNLYDEYSSIPSERRFILDEIANYIIGSIQFEGKASLLVIGSNNATRSIFVESWAHAAAYYYGISNVYIHSGGINATKISTNAILALEEAGFIIYKSMDRRNAVYEIKYSYNIPPLIVKSKKFDDEMNPSTGYGALFVCPNADINLPVLKGNNFRTSLHYYDPVAYDNTEESMKQYLLRSNEIALEMFYLFYRLKNAK